MVYLKLAEQFLTNSKSKKDFMKHDLIGRELQLCHSERVEKLSPS
jgi:hypothetical protein